MRIIYTTEVVLLDRLSYYQPIIPNDIYKKISEYQQESIIVGAVFYGEPVGIAIAKANPSKSNAELNYIFVRKKFRGFGIGASLIRKMEQILIETNCQILNSYYVSMEQSKELENLFLSCGFASPFTDMYMYHINPAKNEKNARFFGRKELPSGFSIFPWADLTDVERKLIKEGENLWYPDFLSPLSNEEKIEYKTSIGLRYKDEVVGWVITGVTPFHALEYSSFFLQERFQKLGIGLTLGIKAVELQLSVLREIPIAYFRVAASNGNMLTIFDEKIGSFFNLEKKERKKVIKQLFGKEMVANELDYRRT